MKKLYYLFSVLLCCLSFTNLSAQCPTGELQVTIEVKTDNYGYEAYWQLLPAGSNCGSANIFAGGNTTVGCNGGGAQNQNLSGYGNNITIVEGPWCLTAGADYKIYLVDDWGDGGTQFTVKIGGYPVHHFKGVSTNESFTFKVQMPPAKDGALKHFHTPTYVYPGAVMIKGEIENRGTTDINSFTINYTINNGSVVSDNVTGVNIQPFTHEHFIHPTPWNTGSPGNYNVKMWLSNINGTGADADATNDTISKMVTVKPARVNKIDEFLSGYQIREIANSTNNLITPRDLDFHPNGELWLVNQMTEATGGSTVTIYNPGKPNQVNLYRKDPNSWHFMSLPSGIAFSDNNNFATSTSVFDANHNGGQPFTGPALWTSDSSIYAQNLFGPLGSHMDMLHESPHCMGIASEGDNIFWVMDAHNKDIVRYDFKADHGPGNDDHSDGEILRYKGMTVNWINQDISSHLELDDQKKWLYIVDGGNKRVLRLDITTGTQSGTPTFGPFEPLALYANVVGATWEVVTDTGLVQPVGIDVIADRMIVSDHSDGNIYIYDISSMPATRIGTIATSSAGIQGIVIGPEGNIWYVNSQNNTISVIESDLLGSSGPAISNILFNIYPNPTNGIIHINNITSNADITITDISGKVVLTEKSITDNQSVNLRSLQNGVYFINVKTTEGNGTKKIILSK